MALDSSAEELPAIRQPFDGLARLLAGTLPSTVAGLTGWVSVYRPTGRRSSEGGSPPFVGLSLRLEGRGKSAGRSELSEFAGLSPP